MIVQQDEGRKLDVLGFIWILSYQLAFNINFLLSTSDELETPGFQTADLDIATSHCLGMSYFVNFFFCVWGGGGGLRCSNEFHMKLRFGTYGS